MSEPPLTPRERRLIVQMQRLQALLEEPAQTMEAIRKGQVDAFVVCETDEVDRVFVLKSADRLHRLIVESMGEGAIALSEEGAITYCNPHFLQLAGRDRNDLLGRHLADLFDGASRETCDALLASARDGNSHAEVTLQTASGPIPVSLGATTLSDDDGSHYCVLVNDLREQRAREQLRAAKEAAEIANRAKDEFLAIVSHELRSPITVILGWTRMLQMNRIDRETLTLAIDSIHHSTTRLFKLVDDILDASRLSSGKLTLHAEVTDLREIVSASLNAVRFDVDQKPLHVTVNVPDEPVRVVGDPDRLQQVMVNLLANAVKFTPPAGKIDIDLETRGASAVVTVRDGGEGIDPAFLPYVFDRFRQDDSSTTRAHKGLGLGLAIVRQLVERHGGSVVAHSDGRGKGAMFTVTLPLTFEEQTRVADGANEPLPTLESLRILLVDDEKDTVDVIRTILLSAGASVDTAMSVAEALTRAAAFVPHVIVSDIAMPGEDGFQFIEQLTPTDVPVVAITGKTAPADRDAILAAGFSQYLSKPIDPEELIRVVHKLAR